MFIVHSILADMQLLLLYIMIITACHFMCRFQCDGRVNCTLQFALYDQILHWNHDAEVLPGSVCKKFVFTVYSDLPKSCSQHVHYFV